ncbi:MAG TPA: Spy/CpxP family protein refolding chaperone [Caulobacteraceae bacterium]|nr:Spy/CpxP family protein refolding chaperone [Caulobacteraceae bacterium]
MAFFRTSMATLLMVLALGAFAPTALAQEETNFASLHDALHLSAAQEPAWRAFKAASEPNAEQAARARAAEAMLPRLTSPQRVDLSIAAMQADLETLKARGAALKAFYAQLTPSQQQIFDRQTLPAGQP